MNFNIPLLFGALLLTPLMADAQTFQVKGYGVHSNGGVTYHYSVTNNSPTNVNRPAEAFSIDICRAPKGPDGNRDSELPDLPPIVSPRSGMLIYRDGSGLLSMTAPSGWVGREGRYQERIGHWLEWEVVGSGTPASRAHNLFPGQTLTGLSATRAKAEPAYLNCHFYIGAYGPEDVNGVVEREDVVPPTLSVTLSPNTLKPNEKLAPITATLTVKDDYDPLPEIKLESITANEPLEKEDIKDAQIGTDDRQFKLKAEREGKNKAGRIYTVTYSATDGSGNKATATATVVVPHDERKKDD